MTERLSVTTRDLRRLLAAADPAHLSEGDDPIPATTLGAIQELVSCDGVSYNVGNFARGEWLYGNFVGDAPNVSDELCDDVEAHYHYWDDIPSMLPCNYSFRTGEHTTVHRPTDFFTTQREFFASPFGEMQTLMSNRFALVVPISMEGGVFRRVLLWRYEGRDFSERERLLLHLLRPHLVELEQAALHPRQPLPLTNRQTQIVHLVADGLTNRQIARHTGLSEGTVRTHLQHAFERLGVQSRAAAVALVLKDGLPEAEHLDAAQPQIQDDVQAPRRLTLTSSA